MAHNDTSMPQTTSSLSAEAESFVPGRLKKNGAPSGPGPGPGLIGHKGSLPSGEVDSSMSPQQISQLPHYLTSCYPFVSSDPRMNNLGVWQGRGRAPSNSNVGGHRMPAPQQAFNNRGSGRQVKGQHTMNLRHPFPGHPGPMSPGHPGPMSPGHPGPMSPGLLNQGLPGPAGMNNPYMPFMQQMGVGQGWPPGSHMPMDYPPGQFMDQYRDQLQGQYTAGQGPGMGQDWNGVGGGEKSRSSSERKKKKKSELASNMVSIGIQNESGVQHNSGSGSKRKAKTKTIICKHAEIQTDFSDELANLTLAEKPNSLYNKDYRSRSWLQRYQESSTDSEEKDSDSGYSSPLHRRNQASNGTHPVIGLPYRQSGFMPGPQNPATLVPGPPPAGMYSQFVPPNSLAYGNFTTPQNLLSSAPSYAAAAVAAQFLPAQPAGYPPAGLLPTTPGLHLSNTNSNPANNPTNKLDTPTMGLPSAATTNNVNTTPKNKNTISLTHSLRPSRSAKTEPEDEESSSGKKKKRRNRRKKRQSCGEEVGAMSDDPYALHRAHSSSNVSRTSTIENDLTVLHFDDEDEFPNLMSASGGMQSNSLSQSSAPLSYSDILKSVPSLSQDSSVSSLDRLRYTGGQSGSSTPSELKIAGKESKNARKRRKRREAASQAADDELAEITLEQQVLKELNSSKPPSDIPIAPKPQGGKKSKQPISLNIADMISALEQSQEKEQQKKAAHPKPEEAAKEKVTNILDASAPAKRGKEREVPKVKKPSPLKKVILKEREEKKRLRLFDETDPLSPQSSDSSQLASVAGMPLDSDLSQDAGSSKASSMDYTGTSASADMSPISQTSPISMSPLSCSPLSSGVNSPIASSNYIAGPSRASIAMKIHSRRFREYCNQMLDKDIDQCCTVLLQDLVRFQDRLYHKDPIKAKTKRRIVLGLREVTKHLKLGRIKCVIISPNLERIQSKGGLDEALNTIIDLCSDQDVPFVFALGRRALGRACAKLVPVSVVGVFNYEGTEENFKRLMDQTEKGRTMYKEMVSSLEEELEQCSTSGDGSTPGATRDPVRGFAQLFPHLGHSRTPSASSAISFTSSILSEPISENYPQSEPETDSRGYEIDRSKQVAVATQLTPAPEESSSEKDEDERSDSPASSNLSKRIIVENLHEYDGDTEDDPACTTRKKASVSCASAMEEPKPAPVSDEDEDDDDDADSVSTDQDSQTIEKAPVEEAALPHIDSIHSLASVEVSLENLSQHSSKTVDAASAEVLSQHSSRTLEGDRSAVTAGTPELCPASSPREAPAAQQRLRSVDNKERVQSWVTESQRHFKGLTIRVPDYDGANGDASQVCDHQKDGDSTPEAPSPSSSGNDPGTPTRKSPDTVTVTNGVSEEEAVT